MIRRQNLKEHPAPLVEFFQPFGTKLLQTASCLLYGFLRFEASLGEELIGKADDLLLDAYGLHIAVG